MQGEKTSEFSFVLIKLLPKISGIHYSLYVPLHNPKALQFQNYDTLQALSRKAFSSIGDTNNGCNSYTNLPSILYLNQSFECLVHFHKKNYRNRSYQTHQSQRCKYFHTGKLHFQAPEPEPVLWKAAPGLIFVPHQKIA